MIFDDATSEVYDVKLVEEESTVTVMEALKRVVETRGLFCSLYSDRGSHMAWTPKADGPVERAAIPHRSHGLWSNWALN